jgi:hypothetical protein
VIAIIHIEREHIHFLVFTFAVLFMLLGWSIFRWQHEDNKASVIRAHYAAVSVESRLNHAESQLQGLEFMYEYGIAIAEAAE